MFDEIYNPFHMVPSTEEDPLKDTTLKDCVRLCVMQVISFFLMLVVALVVCAVISMLTGCTTPKAIEHHHHHYEQTDTLAIQAQIDRRLSSWHAQMDSSWRQSWQEYSASLFSNEDEKEKVTETITTFVDSLGREVRQEQRTTERSLSRMQQQTEQRLTREFEMRLSTALDSVNDLWQQRFDRYQTHWEQTDSIHVKETPATKTELPWYKRWWQTLKDYLLMAGIVALLIITRSIWWPWCKKLFHL